ncbi:ggdef domain-containing protein [Roseibium sp. TrichSKD4]|nr:ggdef domain-containing protein [Roseibium sp. TrichSKD4]
MSAAVEFIGAFLLFLFVRTSPSAIDARSVKSLTFWIISFAMCGFGLVALISRGYAPDWISYLFANAAILLAADMRRVAVSKFWGIRSSHWLGLLAAAGWTGLYFVPAFKSSYAAIVFYVHAALLVIVAKAAYQVLSCNRGRLRTARWLGWTYCVAALTHFYVAFSAVLSEHSIFQPFSSIEVIGGYVGIMFVTLFVNTIIVFAMVTEREQLKFQELAQVDPLTNLNNRRAFLNEANDWLKRNSRKERDFSVIMLDLDHFKKVNDTHGHAIGDKVLKISADVLKTELPNDAAIGRLGGEEFAILLKNTPHDRVMYYAERVRCKFIEAVCSDFNGALSVTLSAGYHTENTRSNCPLNTAMAFADRALYQAKDAGRNRVYSSKKPKLDVVRETSRVPEASGFATPKAI